VEYVLILVIAVLVVTTLMFLPVPRSESPTGMAVGNKAANRLANTPVTPKYTCTDTDGGINVEERGTVSGLSLGKKFSKTDYCIDNKTVKEYTCNKEGRMREFAMKCEGGRICEGGECVSNLTCVDSDGGRDYFVEGKTSGYPRLEIEHQGEVYDLDDYVELEDYCYTEKEGPAVLLREYFCKDGRVAFYNKECDDGCEDDVCLNVTVGDNVTCTDTDGGRNYAVKGRITWGTVGEEMHNATDECDGPGLLTEYYCDGKEKAEEYVDCRCMDGTCVEEELQDAEIHLELEAPGYGRGDQVRLK
jgi:hypothetical protein